MPGPPCSCKQRQIPLWGLRRWGTGVCVPSAWFSCQGPLYMKLCIVGNQSTIAAEAASSVKAHKGVCTPPCACEGEGEKMRGK